mmetsp:Transcript_22155/g.31657  ORF Transcript_22155/g.31657 Transcript_22155/m.31657 type:complete len:208 (-) Transcript_22155:186-809(-)
MPRPSIATIAVLCCHLVGCSNAFIAPPKKSPGTAPKSTTSSSSTATSLHATRRNFLHHSLTTTTSIILTTTLAPQASLAKEAIEITPTLVTETFTTIRNELTSPTGLISTLTTLIDNGSFEEIIQYTKESDAYFRKAKLGKARKLLTDKNVKDEAVLMSNAVTFDLIGINRASRPGRESREDQLRYLEELKRDVEKFLELEKTIVFE